MDVLSDTLRVVRLTGAVFLNMRMTAPWAAASEPPDLLAAYFRLPSDCLALFHILVEGRGCIAMSGYAPVMLEPGDAILLPHSSPHTMSSDLRMRVTPVPMRAILPSQAPEGVIEAQGGGPGAPSQFICGYLHCDQRFNPLLGALPPLIVVRVGSARSAGADATGVARDSAGPILIVAPDDWLGMTLRHMAAESLGEYPGRAEMLARLSEILFAEMVRRYMNALAPADHGWLAGVRDPIVGQALRLIHEQPERLWTVGELADAAAVARSTLAQRFTALIGETPMRYLAAWRIQVAKRLLCETDARLAEIATRVGYESEAAFNRAFRRHVGYPPATWRAANEPPPLAPRAHGVG